MEYLKEYVKILKSDIIMLIMLLNIIPMIGLSIYLKVLDGNFLTKDISFETFSNHPTLSIWYFSHAALLIGLAFYKYVIKRED